MHLGSWRDDSLGASQTITSYTGLASRAQMCVDNRDSVAGMQTVAATAFSAPPTD